MSDDDFEIKEPADYSYGNKEEAYSHSTLVMSCLRDCKEKRSREMRDGYMNTKFDKLGNAHRVWIPDSRLEFIEAVESLMMLQERDYDEDATSVIDKIKEALSRKFTEYCDREEQEWKTMPQEKKQQLLKKGTYFRRGFLSEELPYRYEFIRDKVFFYTRIVSEVQKLIKRMGDYKEEIWEA